MKTGLNSIWTVDFIYYGVPNTSVECFDGGVLSMG